MLSPSSSGLAARLTGALFVLLSLALGAGGIYLAALGGSLYYLVAAVVLLATGVLLFKQRPSALVLYALLLLASTVWAVGEVRFDLWQLVPRLGLWAVLGLWLLLPPVRRALKAPAPRQAASVSPVRLASPWPSRTLGAATAAAILVTASGLLTDYHSVLGDVPDASMAATGYAGVQGTADGDWTAYGRSDHGDRYSPAAQITPVNAGQLKEAWTFHTGDFKGDGDPGEIANEVTPLKANGKLYICTPHNIVIALDPDTGREVWRHDPKINRNARSYQHMICRGVAYYDAASPANAALAPAAGIDPAAVQAATAACPRRIYAPTADATLIALNADTGEPCTGFGNRGVVDLKMNMGHVVPGFLNPTSPPAIGRRSVIMAASVTDNDSTDEPSGVIRGFDVDTGRLLWNWDSGQPDRTEPFGPDDVYTRNSPNSVSYTHLRAHET